MGMRTTVDIPDATYRRLESKAADECASIEQLVVRGAEAVLRESPKRARRFPEPPVPGEPRAILSTSEMIHDLPDASLDPRPRLTLPLVGGEPGSLVIDNEMIYDLIGFP